MSEHTGLQDCHEWDDEAVEYYWLERARGVDEGDWREDPQMRAWLLVDFQIIDAEMDRRIAIHSLF